MLKTPPPFVFIGEHKFKIAALVVLLVILVLGVRLWYVQIYRGAHYSRIAEHNRMRKIAIPAPRGLIYDRHGRLLLGNRPSFNLLYSPPAAHPRDHTLQLLAGLVQVPASVLAQRVESARGRPEFLPIVLKRALSQHEVSLLNINRMYLPGIDTGMFPQRNYHEGLPAHLLGYIGQIDADTLQAYRQRYPHKNYQPHDLVGKQGLELRWESHLRGLRGYEVVQVDALGRRVQRNAQLGLRLPRQEAVPGANLELTLDYELQRSVAAAFKGKRGAVIAMNPRNGAILATLSMPQFDPQIYVRRLSHQRWQALLANPFHPLLDKTSGGEYAPGSIYKVVTALAALGDELITPQTQMECRGRLVLGGDTFHCHQRRGHGQVNLKQALVQSCDVFFYHLGLALGVDRIAAYARKFALGRKLDLNLNAERRGLIPTRAWKLRRHRQKWQRGENTSIAIGQGYNLLTPLQMVSLYATIANGGTVWRPWLVRRVVDHYGKPLAHYDATRLQHSGIEVEHLQLLRNYLRAVVSDPRGTGQRANLAGVKIAGKTGSVQTVSLRKYQHDSDVSTKWREHAIFAAFSPPQNADIAVVVVSENDRIGGGGTAAAPIAAQIIKAWRTLQHNKRTARR